MRPGTRNAVALFALMLAGTQGTIGGRAQATLRWPAVSPVRRSYRFPVASAAVVRMAVRSPAGAPLYILQCRPIAAFPNGVISTFECALVPAANAAADVANGYSLLTSDPMNPTARGRGLVSADEIWSTCGDYPEYGRVRRFRLRGMVLTLDFKHVGFVTERKGAASGSPIVHAIKSFELDVSVSQDPTALSAVAEPAAYRAPPMVKPVDALAPEVDCAAKPEPSHVPGVVTHSYATHLGLGPPFPMVQPVRAQFKITPDPQGGVFSWGTDNAPQGYSGVYLPYAPLKPRNRVVYLPIYGASGQLAYELECTAYEDPEGSVEVEAHPSPAKIDRWGILCGLFARGSSFNLLLDAVDPYSRMNPAEILPGQLYGVCAGYPDWGTKRAFRLRGLRITMRFADPRFTQGDFSVHALTSVDLTVSASPDHAATSPLARAPKYIYWGVDPLRTGSCSTALVPPHERTKSRTRP